ncbi:UNVERIFIED_CONTAM: hypothetical protein GTU68_060581, partial [Idotea baltica]|nr:hypothetical protein [Idotea baltica]
MLEIRDLHVTLKKKYILKGINLVININEIHVLMGPNGSGKSTLSNVLVGSTHYTIRKGVIKLNGIALNSLSPDKRASLGLFLCFQYPVEIPGISNLQFLKVAINSIRKYQNKKKINYVIFMQNLKAYTKQLKMNSSIMSRGVNEGFSGGEKKKNEILQ